ncbi:unnamed protein product [Calicophoron daubneyi]|uniref:J domain-containing protein n=1 Tax=Calicophoron daubneyi TaxID=300641 RepID=A0AAV2TGG0_CALDB
MAAQVSLAEQYKINGNSSYQQGLYDEALQWYSRAIEEDTQNALLYSNRSAAYLMLKKYLEAYRDASRSVELNPHYCKALLRCSKCSLNLGRVEEARQMCTAARDIDPLNSELPALCEQIDLLQQNYRTYGEQLLVPDLGYALHLISKCCDLAPGCLDFQFKRLNLLIQMKRFTEAKQRVELILHTNEVSAELLYYRGLCLFYLDHLDKAMTHFQHVLRLNPDHVESQQAFRRAKNLLRLKNEGNQYIHDRRFSRAYETYTEALKIDPLHDAINAKLYCNRACAAYNLDKYDAALDDCNIAISLDPSYIKAYARRAKCYGAMENFEKCVEEWNTVVNMDPTSENKQALQAAKRSLARSKQVDYYKVLGVKRNASSDEIKQAYKKRALLHHPDRHTDADEATKLEHEQKFKEVGEAYSVLSDPQKRQQYDSGMYAADGFSGGKMHARNLFTQVFPGFNANGSTVHFCFS